MEKYLEKIIENNASILKDCELKKLNVGFTNLVYSADDKYIIKICNKKNNEKKFENEINFYLRNAQNDFMPKLYKYYISNNELDYSYEIIEKVKGTSLYFVWHTFDEEKRKKIIKKISLMMKSFHSIKGVKYDWPLFIKEKLLKDLEICNKYNVFNIKEQEKLNFVINNSNKYLVTEEFGLVHSDIHFDNVLIDANDNLKLIDFETAIYAPIDYELDIFLRMCSNPIKYSSEETEKLVKTEDYINIPKYLKEYYPKIFDFEHYDIRHLIYDLEANLRLLTRFSNNQELKDVVITIINKLCDMI